MTVRMKVRTRMFEDAWGGNLLRANGFRWKRRKWGDWVVYGVSLRVGVNSLRESEIMVVRFEAQR